jgi:hypothetical protein
VATNGETINDAEVRGIPIWPFFVLPLLAVLLFAVVVGVYAKIFIGPLSLDHDKWGQFGDYVGGVLNPLLAFFGLIALLVTIRLQVKELKLSTRELSKSAVALQRQNAALVHQNFESTFFQLLRRVGWLAEATKFGILSGRAALKEMYISHLQNEYYLPLVSKGGNAGEVAVKAYELFYDRHHDTLGHYFRTLYHLFTFIDKSILKEEDKAIYANIARAQLSTYELCLLFYNGASKHGERFKPLLEKYGILKHVYENALLSRNDKFDFVLYTRLAFAGREEREQLQRA